MDQQTATRVARALANRLPTAAPVLGIAGTATRVWAAHYTHPDTEHTAMKAVIDATWALGYPAGAAQGRQIAADVFQRQAFDEMAELSRRTITDHDALRLLWAVASAATPTTGHIDLISSGPDRRDYLTAWDDHGDTSAVGRLAAAARVGWMHGYYTGRTDAAWATTSRFISEVTNQLGTATIQSTWIAEMPGHEWLATVEFTARQAAGLPRQAGPARHSFRPLTVAQGSNMTTSAGASAPPALPAAVIAAAKAAGPLPSPSAPRR